jgi:hypothetical protein
MHNVMITSHSLAEHSQIRKEFNSRAADSFVPAPYTTEDGQSGETCSDI